jgi:hypothetical protein
MDHRHATRFDASEEWRLGMRIPDRTVGALLPRSHHEHQSSATPRCEAFGAAVSAQTRSAGEKESAPSGISSLPERASASSSRVATSGASWPVTAALALPMTESESLPPQLESTACFIEMVFGHCVLICHEHLRLRDGSERPKPQHEVDFKFLADVFHKSQECSGDVAALSPNSKDERQLHDHFESAQVESSTADTVRQPERAEIIADLSSRFASA